MTSFPLLVRCHSAVNVISCMSNYVQTQAVSAVFKSRTAVNWESEETLGLFALSAAAFNQTIFWIISRLCLHFFIQSFYLLAAWSAQGKSPWYSWLFQPLLKMWSTDGQSWLRTRFERFSSIFLTLKMVQKFNWNARSWMNKRKRVGTQRGVYWVKLHIQ